MSSRSCHCEYKLNKLQNNQNNPEGWLINHLLKACRRRDTEWVGYEVAKESCCLWRFLFPIHKFTRISRSVPEGKAILWYYGHMSCTRWLSRAHGEENLQFSRTYWANNFKANLPHRKTRIYSPNELALGGDLSLIFKEYL